MPPERRRAKRYPFIVTVELTDLQSEAQIREQASDVSLFGCHVNTLKPWPAGTRVRIRIMHRGGIFVAYGRVASFSPNKGMGIVFTGIEENDETTLEKWLDERRER